MEKATEYQKNIKNLFEEWKSKPNQNGIDHQNSVFIRDGIVCPEKWFSQKVRPLFLLKEAYGGDKDWNLITDYLLTSRKMQRGTWPRVTLWTKGLLSTSSSWIEPYSTDESMKYYGNQYLQQIAVVNIKKSGGNRNSNLTLINQYAATDKEELRREIELIDPTIIICGYTISSLNIIMGQEIKNYNHPEQNLYYSLKLGKCDKKHNVIVLDYWHPSNYYPDIMNYYGLMSIYQQALLHQGR